MPRLLLPAMLLVALLAPATAGAEVVVADPAAQQVSALGGTLVWVTGEGPGQRLMRRAVDGTVSEVDTAPYLRRPDLGRDADGRLVLSYARCRTITRCRYVRSDLAGERTRFTGLAPRRCAVSSTPAVWGRRVAYGLGCRDAARSGLYVKRDGAAPQRLPAPRNARRAGALSVDDTDLRGRRVAALYVDVYSYAVVQSVRGGDRKSVRAAVNEGDGEQSAAGLTAAAGDARLWYLTRSSHPEGPPQAVVNRVRATCADYEVLTADEGEEDYPYVDLAVDGDVLYAVDPGAGVVTHAYQPQFGCGL